MSGRTFTFVGGNHGSWHVVKMDCIAGTSIDMVERLDIVDGFRELDPAIESWALRGIVSNERYVTRSEKNELVGKSPPLGRPEANCAALIPIRKSPAWWMLTQDERRGIFEEISHHIAIGVRYLPAIARRLHHCRDLSTDEPFDFLTLFEFPPSEATAFDQLVAELRALPEWQYVDREVDIRMIRPTSI